MIGCLRDPVQKTSFNDTTRYITSVIISYGDVVINSGWPHRSHNLSILNPMSRYNETITPKVGSSRFRHLEWQEVIQKRAVQVRRDNIYSKTY